ncbi:hypothetical protein JOF41_002835 [Saccharothrix coeruleofusca]|uniref:DUF2000 domain-containing protein n=1 Tax=Saccharothrix coeruleofusca TaxID=33919 RepID=UPI001AEB09AD|nr:DUF2000 domain-containing protein [Saccharothrix coeruleofusca]MBP2336657.1 hypothetical protein [Saccharothrix coeruleofusca]
MVEQEQARVGFEPEEVDPTIATREARLKWVILVDEALPAGRAVNAAVCAASATAVGVRGLLGPDAKDASGQLHPGLPWAGCSILAASAERIAEIRAKAVESLGVFVADTPVQAQATRVYDEYLRQVGEETSLDYCAVSIVGPRNRVDKLVKKLPLLS